MNNIIFFVLLGLVIGGCDGNQEVKSSPFILTEGNERFNYNPLKAKGLSKSEGQFLATLPPLNKPSNYTYNALNIPDDTDSIVIKSIQQDLTKSKIQIDLEVYELSGKLYLGKNCTKAGFISCRSWTDTVYRIKDHDTSSSHKLKTIKNLDFNKDRRIKAHSIFNGYIKQIVREDTNSGSIEYRHSTASTLNLKFLNQKTFTFIFNGIDTPIKRFDLREGNSGSWNFSSVSLGLSIEEQKENTLIIRSLSKVKLDEFSMEALKLIYTKFNKYRNIKDIIAGHYLNRAAEINSIETLHKFNDTFSDHESLINSSVKYIFTLIKNINSVAGYEWFVEKYPNSDLSPEAISSIHRIMYSKANKVATVSSYNSFIFSYPMSEQAELAIQKSYDLEEGVYRNLGLFGLFDYESKKEKMARRLLIKAKQIERAPRDMELSRLEAAGYKIVANRMYKLLQSNFSDSEATLRHLESKEFIDFTVDYLRTMKDVKRIISDIRNNTNNLSHHVNHILEISRKEFNIAKSDRKMSAYYTKIHREWEKNMDFRSRS